MLRILSEKKKRYFYEKNLNSICNVLFEKDIKNNFIYGYTENYIRVKTKLDKKLTNKIIPCVLNSIDSNNIVEVSQLVLKNKSKVI